MSLRNICAVFLLTVFSLSVASCGGSSTATDDATDDTTGATTTESFPETLGLNISDNLKGEDAGDESVSADLYSVVGDRSEYVNEITTAFATTFGSQGNASTEAIEGMAAGFNEAGVTTGNNCVTGGEAEYRCVVEDDATFDSTAYGRVARCYKDGERYLEWYLNNNDTDTNNGVLIAQSVITEDGSGPEDPGDLMKARLDYNLDDADAKSVLHTEAISRDDDATLVSTLITLGLENETAGTVDLEALFYGDYSGTGTPTTNHDLAKHDSSTDYTYIVGVAYNNHSELPGDADDAECIDTGNEIAESSNCTGLEVDLADVTVDPEYVQSVTEVDGTSLEFSSDFAETMPSDLEAITCTEVEIGGGSEEGGDGPSEEELQFCMTDAGIASAEETMGDIGEEDFNTFCLCVFQDQDFEEAEAQCAAGYAACDSTDTLQECVDSQGS